MSQQPVPLRRAATVVILRDGAAGPQVLLLRRHARSGFAGDAWVFPGGTVDPVDGNLDPARWTGIDPSGLAERFSTTAEETLAFHVAAVRETFEEAGLLLGHAAAAPSLALARAALSDGSRTTGWAPWLAEEGLVLDLGALTYHSRWVTPRQEPRRYDTAFFVARAPDGQVVTHDAVETTGQRWVTPFDALASHDAGRMHLIYPTIRTLEALARFASAAEVIAAADRQPVVRSIQPHLELSASGVRILHPDDPDYPHDPIPFP